VAIAHQFEYVKPPTLGEAVRLLARYGSRARALAGGTDLVGLISDGMVTPEAVVDLKGIPGLDRIKFKNGVLSIGALVTFSDLRESPIIASKFPMIREMTGWVASVGIRNRATMVGNLCSAVPCCDSGAVLLVYDAAVLVTGPAGKRKVPLREWFLGPRKTVLKRGEIATAVTVALPKKKHGACFVKLRRYEGEDLAQASVTVLALAGNRYRISFGSVAPRPIAAERIEALLEGQALSDDLIQKAVGLVPQEITPITDIRATKEYRLHMIGVMLERGLRAAVARMIGTGPDYGTSLI
jgi:CO/xanthine dehydrogenase FAD-binding subunit